MNVSTENMKEIVTEKYHVGQIEYLYFHIGNKYYIFEPTYDIIKSSL